MNLLKRILKSRRLRNGLGIIITAAILLELISVMQYYYTRNLLEEELVKRAENEMVMKAILIKGMLNTLEKVVQNHTSYVSENLDDPDASYRSLQYMIESNSHIVGCGMAFKPYYYQSKGRLFEPFASIENGQTVMRQISGPSHDYTTMEFYNHAAQHQQEHWSDPYLNDYSRGQLISSYSVPVKDRNGEFACVLALDMSLDWLSDTLNYRHVYPSSFDLLLTESGRLICRPGSSHPNSDDVDQVVRLINDSTTTKYKNAEGHIKVIDFESEHGHGTGSIFFHNMKGNPHWQIVVVCYDKEVYGKYDRMQMLVLTSMLGALLLLLFIIMRFARNYRKLHEANIIQERIGSELRIARGLQMSMLPLKDPEFLTRRTDVDVQGLLEPAVEVGGDLYDYLIRDEKLYFCIGDVSGKGVPSALVMAVMHSLFLSLTTHESDPSRIMQALNEAACRNNKQNMFVTFFIGVLDLPTGRLRYCNAGHNVPVLVGCGPTMLPVKPNLPIGLFDNFRFTIQEIILEKGQSLFLYTDGLTEAMDVNHEQYGIDRLLGVLSRCKESRAMSPEQVLGRVYDDLKAFVGDAQQSDDLTMFVVNYSPNHDVDLTHKKLSLRNDLKMVPELNHFVASVSNEVEMDEAVASQVKLAVEEAVVNVMNYAYPVGTHGDITVEAQYNKRMVKFIITDAGKSFDPTMASSVDTSLSAEDRPIGGLGIFLVRELMDSINYERIEGKNILTITKLINNNHHDEDKN